MSVPTPDMESVTENLDRLRRRATAALFVAAGSFAIAAVALAMPYSTKLRALGQQVLL